MGRIALRLILVLASLSAAPALPAGVASDPGPAPATDVELSFIRGDTRAGDKVRIRVVGDSLQYFRTEYSPGRADAKSRRTVPLDAGRKLALRRILGELPRYRVFDSCFGKGMRFYLVDTPAGRLYRSVPERSARCFGDEPGILSLLEDLDAFMTPPADAAPDSDMPRS
jgi:hypothetical protein